MIEDPDIAVLRKEIDRIDHQLLELIRRRALVVLEVGDKKRQRNLPVYDPKREEKLLERLCRDAQQPVDSGAAERIFRQVVTECRRLEESHVANYEAVHERE